jgi:hypothetical protein
MVWVRHVYPFDLLPPRRASWIGGVPCQWILWPNWPTWRWAQISPECIGYRDVEHTHHSDRWAA